jgi:hypothetical protein
MYVCMYLCVCLCACIYVSMNNIGIYMKSLSTQSYALKTSDAYNKREPQIELYGQRSEDDYYVDGECVCEHICVCMCMCMCERVYVNECVSPR